MWRIFWVTLLDLTVPATVGSVEMSAESMVKQFLYPHEFTAVISDAGVLSELLVNPY